MSLRHVIHCACFRQPSRTRPCQNRASGNLHYKCWERGSVPLKFQLGDVHLGKVVLPLLRRAAELDEPPMDIGDTPEPPAELDGADGYVVWSQPLTRRKPRVVVSIAEHTGRRPRHRYFFRWPEKYHPRPTKRGFSRADFPAIQNSSHLN